MDLTREVERAKERLHRSIAQRARWARHDFLREIEVLRGQSEFLYGRTPERLEAESGR